MSRKVKNLNTMIDDWTSENNATINSENWYSVINKEDIGIADGVSINRNRISDLEAQLKELKIKKKRRKLKIKVKM